MDAAPRDPRIEVDLVRALYAQTVRSIIPAPIGGGVMVAALWATSDTVYLLAWYWLLLANCAVRYALFRRFPGADLTPVDARRWARRFAWSTFGNGVLFGSLALLFFPPGDPLRQMLIMLMIGAACTAGAAVAYYPPAMAGFMGGLIVPAFIRFAIEDGVANLFVTFGVAFLLAVVLNFGFGQARMLRELIVTRRRNLDLIEEMREKTTVAEAAQRKAEDASLAKSQFFAAASHDLRQPLQALGLYAASLREAKRAPEDARKIDQILSSVDALESLFDELLDISKLDAGYVEPHRSHFVANRLFERLETSFSPLAHKNGLALKFSGGENLIHSDPVLLERVLANLVSNALRYTEDGGVAVRCESADGTRAILVEDSGIGIPAPEQDRVFDEFYQLGNPERDRRKGLGLGLATVRRITRLLGHRITMTSAPGAGTTFRIEVPAGDPSQVAAHSVSPTGVEVDALVGRSVLVVEDDAMVREGMVQLLQDWQCRVTAAASAADALALLRAAPDAVVADYRLRENRNGIAAIEAIRAHFGRPLPAILITGDTAPEIFVAAREHKLPLLSKPVRAARLRAALQHLFSERREPARAAA